MKVAVVGGGISGLAAAYYLARRGAGVVLIEREPRLGGLLRTDCVDGCVVECGPDSFLASKPWAMELIRELGLEDEVIPSNDRGRVTYILRAGRLIPLPEGVMMVAPSRIGPMLRTPLLGWRAKLGMGLEFFRRPALAGADRSVEEFLLAHFGREVADYIAEPLLAGVYGGDPARLSARAVLPQFVEMERRYGSLTRGAIAARRNAVRTAGPVFRSLKRGLGSLVERLVETLRGRVEFVTGVVESVEPGFRLRVSGADFATDAVLVACPAWAAAPVMRPLNEELGGLLEAIPYNDALTLALGYSRADCVALPPGFGFLVPKRERERLLACTFVHNKFDGRAPADKAVLRCFFGAGAMDLDDAGVVAAARGELRRILGLTATPLFANVSRWPRAMPQYNVGHEDRVQRIESIVDAIPGLALAGNAYHGIGIPDCIRGAKEAAEALAPERE